MPGDHTPGGAVYLWLSGSRAGLPVCAGVRLRTAVGLPLPTSSPAGTVHAVWLQHLWTVPWAHESVRCSSIAGLIREDRGLVLWGSHWIRSGLLETLILSACHSSSVQTAARSSKFKIQSSKNTWFLVRSSRSTDHDLLYFVLVL